MSEENEGNVPDESNYLSGSKISLPGLPLYENGELTGNEHVYDMHPRGNITVLEMDTFFEFIANADKPVLVDFWALWCAPCAGMIPIYEEIAAEQDSFYVAKVNVDKCKPLASQYSIMVIPTAVLFKDGKPVASLEGTASKEDILGSIGQFL